MKMRLAVAALLATALLTTAALAQKETRGVTATEIVLGMHTDLSGPAATYGVSSSNAVATQNRSGSVARRCASNRRKGPRSSGIAGWLSRPW